MDYKQTIEELINILVTQNGSDIHLSAGRKPSIRVAGQLLVLVNNEPCSQEMMSGILEALVGKDKAKIFMENKELDFSFTANGGHRLRGNAFFQREMISIVMRLIPKTETFQSLNLPEILQDLSLRQQGFFLVVGPVGQGKSTTMSAMVNYINQKKSVHIVTIEDPIEFVHNDNKSIIDQREVGIDTKSFESALSSVFREDVNVILIGEMRNPETISAAVTAAETGHLVISTLHTNTASQTIDRIIDTFPSTQQDQIRVQLANSLLGVFSQRLIPRIAGGLIPAYALMINNDAIGNLIREKRTHEIDVVIETSSQQGMIDMNRSLLELVRKGEITIESAYQYSFNPKALEQLL
jgi:twitching motility protein PilT